MTPSGARSRPLFSVRLAEERARLSLSQVEVARRLAVLSRQVEGEGGVDERSVRRWEHGVMPVPRYRRLLCRLYAATPEQLGFVQRQQATGLSTVAAPLSAIGPASAEVGLAGAWRVSLETAADLERLVGSYRRAYAGRAGVDDLLPAATGVMRLLLDLGKRDRWPRGDARLTSLVGQAAVLAGLLELMGRRDLHAARAHYDLALRAAREADDGDLMAYVLGSLAFHAVSAGRDSEARQSLTAAERLADAQASPRTRAWVAALASEIHARDRDEAASMRSLERAHAAIDQTRHLPAWKGVGWFDSARLAGYEGGNLLLLGRYAMAKELLGTALDRLDETRLKHRCTLSADLAIAHACSGEPDQACAHAKDALVLARAIAHRESVDRVHRARERLLQWRTSPAVRELTESLGAL